MTKTVALAQIASPDEESREARIERVEAMLREQRGADLYVLPELWSAGYFSFDRYGELAEAIDGPTVSMARRVARELGAAVHLGSFVERDEGGRLRNTTALIDRDGEIAQLYRKIHVFGYRSLEAELLAPGEGLSVAQTELGPLTSTTCYDLRFPGLWQQISARGAEVAVIPAAWPAARREHWRVLTQARAIEHQLWVLACNACGEQGGVELGGYSRVVDPSGRVVAECGAEEEMVIAEVDPGLAARVRAEFPVIADRLSPDAYERLSADPLG